MKDFRKLNTADLEQYRALKQASLKNATEERSFFKQKAYSFPAYIKQAAYADDEVKHVVAILVAIDNELDNR